MKKIPCLFVHQVSDGQRDKACSEEVTPGCEWVLAGEGIATRKWDGTACLIREGQLYARYDAKRGKTPPPDAIPCDPVPDPITGHWPHWVPVAFQPEYKYHSDAFGNLPGNIHEGTYELIGPPINSNRERINRLELVPHGEHEIIGVERTHVGLCEFLSKNAIEGIVFHHPDGRMAKIRRSDFCIPWPAPEVK